MKLRGLQPYLSIPPFAEIELPPLVVLTGINGSGKSQFLRAIENGHIAADLFLHFNQDRVVKPQGAVLLEHGVGQPLKFEAVKSTILPTGRHPATRQDVSRFEQLHDAVTTPAWNILKPLLEGREHIPVRLRSVMWRSGPDHLIEQLQLSEADTATVRRAFREAEEAFGKTPEGNQIGQFRASINRAGQLLEKSPLQVTGEDLSDLGSWGSYPAFAPATTRVFSAYRDASIANRLAKIAAEEGEETDFLSHEAFLERYGDPPWKRVNEILSSFGLEYETVAPSYSPSTPVGFTLRRLGDQTEVQADQLSSGERVLLRFALSLFPFDPLRVTVEMPQLLLLDEMDASLHPEMVNRWLRAIKDGLVDSMGMSCILTTHSPTTVALAPEESLFELTHGSGAPRKVSKQHALNRLTFGVPTLSIDFTGRRQVFVESDTDAACFESLAAILKSRLELPRTLTFLSTGIRTPSNHEAGTGCAAVRKVVNQLRNGGNRSVFGLVDWDGVNEPNEQVFVVGHRTHYALDNILLNPVLVGALLLRDNGHLAGFIGTFGSLGGLNQEGLQALADTIQAPLVYPSEDASVCSERLLGGAAINVRTAHQQMNGHELEAALVAAHPSLTRWSRAGRGKLTEAVVARVVRDYPDLCPAVLANTLSGLSTGDLQ